MSYSAEHDEHRLRNGWSSASVVYIRSTLGTLFVEECDQCGYLDVICEHEFNAWNDAGTVLTCKLCEADGT